MIDWVVGIDYSLSCPAICIHPNSKEWNIDNCKFAYINKKKYKLCASDDVKQFDQKEYSLSAERFANLAADTMLFIYSVTDFNNNISVCIEDYAYGAKGLVFHIGENGGILKHMLWSNDIKFDVVAPTIIKKYATRKGNANKEKMYEQFIIDHPGFFELSDWNLKKLGSPITDLVDAYYIAKYHHSEINK